MTREQDRQNQENQNNMYIISEQGDLGLGTRQLNEEEQKKVNEQRDYYRRQQR